jgi:peptidoglycan/xylan/chitin deacetylase (PgdA/CDA1 family)
MIGHSRCTVVFYHYVRDVEKTAFPGIRALSVADFGSQLDWLQSRFTIVDGPTFEEAIANGRGFDRPAALLTFDDGFVDHYQNVFPELRRRKLGGMFFLAGATLGEAPRLLNVHRAHFLLALLGPEALLAALRGELAEILEDGRDGGRPGTYRYDENPDAVVKRLLNYELPFAVVDQVLEILFRRHLGDPVTFARQLYLSGEMIREMAAGGMTFGFHTETHRVLSRLDESEQRDELLRGVAQVRALTSQPAVPFCYPYGFSHTYNAATLAILAEAGYSVAFNTVRRAARVGVDTRFELPRFDTRDLPPSGQDALDA